MEGSFHGRPEELSTRRRWTALGMTTTGVLDDEALELALKDASVKGKLSLAYLDLTEITPEQATRIRAGAPNITELDLRSNNLTGLPDELGDLRALRVVKLDYNKLEHLPALLTKLPLLTNLQMGGNLLSTVDASVAELRALTDLDLSGNRLITVDPAIARCEKLVYLNLENNMLAALPPEIGSMQNLRVLDLSNCQLATLPDSVSGLTSLTRLEVNNNMLKTLPPSMGRLENLKDLDCRYNLLQEPEKSKAEGPVRGYLEYLKEEEERIIQEEIERLKPVATEAGSYLEYRMKLEDQGPLLRSRHSTTCGANHMYVFGGLLSHEGCKTNELYVTNLDRMVWMKKSPGGERPVERDGHCAVFDSNRKKLLVFGGRDAEKKRLNDLFQYDPEKDRWTRLSPDGEQPAPRESASMVQLDEDTLVLFGGKGAGARFNDLWFLDLKRMEWTQAATKGDAPSPRQDAAICACDGKIYLHAGQDNFVRNDLYELDVSNREEMHWTLVNSVGRPPPPCHSHLLHSIDGKLYVAGGFDELGGQIIKFYSLDLDPSAKPAEEEEDEGSEGEAEAEEEEPAAAAPEPTADDEPVEVKPKWGELDSEIEFNQNRSVGFSTDDQIVMLQVGSKAMGIEASALPEHAFWDVLKLANVLDLQELEVDSEDDRPVNQKKMRVEHTTVSAGKDLPSAVRKGFVSVSGAEAGMLEHVRDFHAQYVEYYPDRFHLLLDPPNECGVRKFVCTTVRPSKLFYAELYDLEPCARFIADYLEYEPLENPIMPPESIPSPYTVLGTWKAGDSFDLSMALCSLLIGVGYDAYVCMGYAPKEITENDQTRDTCPVLEREAAAAAAEDTSKAPPKKKAAASKYKIKEPVDLTCKLDGMLLDEGAGKMAPPEPDESEAPESASPERPNLASNDDKYYGKRVHAWVLVRAGSRGMTETVFIEPTTARKYPVDASPYFGLEYLWNHRNFWVNIQPGTIRQVPALRNLDTNLKDTTKWEPVRTGVEEIEIPIVEEDAEGEAATGEAAAEDAGTAEVEAPTDPGQDATVDDTAKAEKSEVNVDEEGDVDESSEMDGEPTLEMPRSWVPKMAIAQEDFDTTCPRGHKTTRYHRCIHELFAVFGVCSRWDGLVEKLCTFSDDACKNKYEERETFRRRKDKLCERIVKHSDDTKIERFEHGSAFGIKEIREIPDVERETHFYISARSADQLETRYEVFGKRLTETFSGRDDHMVYRSIVYDPEGTARAIEEARAKAEADAAAAAASGPTRRRPKKVKFEEPPPVITKMTQKFELPVDSAVPTHKCVSKRVFDIANESIRVDYHYGPGFITTTQKWFYKDGTSSITLVDPKDPKPNEIEIQEEFHALCVTEKSISSEIRDVEREIKVIVLNRAKEEMGIDLLNPYFDIVRIKTAEESDDEEEVVTEVGFDYLEPYMPPVIPGHDLTASEAVEAKEGCLTALKERLIDRANIIKGRLDREDAALMKRRNAFERDRDVMTPAEEEEFNRACEESTFKINILNQRLERHEEISKRRFLELDAKLRADPRLAAML